MADISITQRHKLTHKKAKAAAQKVAEQIAEEYQMSLEWEDDVLHFRRTGVSGFLALTEHTAHLEIKLGLMFKLFAATIEEHVRNNMRKVFAGKS